MLCTKSNEANRTKTCMILTFRGDLNEILNDTWGLQANSANVGRALSMFSVNKKIKKNVTVELYVSLCLKS